MTTILIEPMFIDGEHMHTLRSRLVAMAYERRDMWPDRPQALDGFIKAKWHPKVAQLFVVSDVTLTPRTSPSQLKGLAYLEIRS